MSEFADRADTSAPDLGRPEDDPPFTIRMQPPWTWERRHDPATPRVVRVDRGQASWAVVDLDDRLRGELAGQLWADHDDVHDWPVQHPVMVAAVMAKLQPERAEPARHQLAEPEDGRGDMDVTAFRTVPEAPD